MGLDSLLRNISVNHIENFYGASMDAAQREGVIKTAKGMINQQEADSLGIDYDTLLKMKIVEVYQQITMDVD